MNKAYEFSHEEVTKILYDAAVAKFGVGDFPAPPFGVKTELKFKNGELRKIYLLVGEVIPGSVNYEDI